MRRGIVFFLVALVLCVLSSCGGGQGGNQTGRAMVRVDWPASTRLVPFASSSIRVLVTIGGRGVGDAVLERPAGGGVATATFDRIPIGEATVNATAHPSAGAGGVAQASAAGTATIQTGQTANLDLVMVSTITQANVSPVTSTLSVGGDVSLVPVFKNAQGQSVFVSLSTLRWGSRNTNVATVDAGGRVVAVAAGTAIVDVTDTESNVTGSATVTVQGNSGGGGGGTATLNPANGHYYQAVAVQGGISWPAAKAAAEARGGYLATITTADENFFVATLTDKPELWEYDGQSELGPWLGGYRDPNTGAPNTNWKWVTGESWGYTKWSAHQPDNDNGVESRLQLFSARWLGETHVGYWNDEAAAGNSQTAPDHFVKSYVIEWNSDPNGGNGGGGGGNNLDPNSGQQPPPYSGTPSATVPTFQAPIYYNYTQTTREVQVADLDQDGKKDIVVIGGTEILALYGKGDGTFENPVSIQSKIDEFGALQVADMNNDGKTDVIATDLLDKIHVVINQGGRNFAVSKFVGGVHPRDMTVGDFNGDGKRDVAVDNGYDLTVFLGDGTGGLTRGSRHPWQRNTGRSRLRRLQQRRQTRRNRYI
ncbi:MAG: FG-GAP-like repeat-containing protein [Armatimonas sp.]